MGTAGIAIAGAATLQSPVQTQRGTSLRGLRWGVYGREPVGKPLISHTHANQPHTGDLQNGTGDTSPHQRTGGNVIAGKLPVRLVPAARSPGAADRDAATASLYFAVDVGWSQSDGDV